MHTVLFFQVSVLADKLSSLPQWVWISNKLGNYYPRAIKSFITFFTVNVIILYLPLFIWLSEWRNRLLQSKNCFILINWCFPLKYETIIVRVYNWTFCNKSVMFKSNLVYRIILFSHLTLFYRLNFILFIGLPSSFYWFAFKFIL